MILSDKRWNYRKLTEIDIKMFKILSALSLLSKCIDKQVACIITDSSSNILSIGINHIINCDTNCADHKNRICNVVHAEIEAIANLTMRNISEAKIAYINLFPCEDCQTQLNKIVDEIVVFGIIHKKVIINKLTVFPRLNV